VDPSASISAIFSISLLLPLTNDNKNRLLQVKILLSDKLPRFFFVVKLAVVTP
jgi:hypothetical protein